MNTSAPDELTKLKKKNDLLPCTVGTYILSDVAKKWYHLTAFQGFTEVPDCLMTPLLFTLALEPLAAAVCRDPDFPGIQTVQTVL